MGGFFSNAGVPEGAYGLHQCEEGCGTWLYPHMFHQCAGRASVTVDGWGRVVVVHSDGSIWEMQG